MNRKWIPAVCVTCIYAIALALLRMNGGFGGGHGLYDLPIGVLALPWDLIESALPDSILSRANDLWLFIIMPFILNMGIVYGLVFLYRSRSRKLPASRLKNSN